MESEIRRVVVRGAAWEGPKKCSFVEWAEVEGFRVDIDRILLNNEFEAALTERLAHARGFDNLRIYSIGNSMAVAENWEKEYGD
jgi:hypothetical protein